MASLQKCFQVFLGFAVLLPLIGCGSYQAGAPAKSTHLSYFVSIVENESALAQPSALLTRQIREAIVSRGGYRLAPSAEKADRIVSITLSQSLGTPRASLPSDTSRAASYDLRLTALARVEDASGKLLREEIIESTTVAYLNPSLPDAEYQATPRLTEDLAQRIADLVLLQWND